jgi:hypothetical protein
VTETPDSHWNYRIVRHENEHGIWYRLCEVYYDKGKPWGYCNADLIAEEVSDLRWSTEKMLAAFDKPVLDEKEITEDN